MYDESGGEPDETLNGNFPIVHRHPNRVSATYIQEENLKPFPNLSYLEPAIVPDITEHLITDIDSWKDEVNQELVRKKQASTIHKYPQTIKMDGHNEQENLRSDNSQNKLSRPGEDDDKEEAYHSFPSDDDDDDDNRKVERNTNDINSCYDRSKKDPDKIVNIDNNTSGEKIQNKSGGGGDDDDDDDDDDDVDDDDCSKKDPDKVINIDKNNSGEKLCNKNDDDDDDDDDDNDNNVIVMTNIHKDTGSTGNYSKREGDPSTKGNGLDKFQSHDRPASKQSFNTTQLPNRHNTAPSPNGPDTAPSPNRHDTAPSTNRPDTAPSPNRHDTAPSTNRPDTTPSPNRLVTEPSHDRPITQPVTELSANRFKHGEYISPKPYTAMYCQVSEMARPVNPNLSPWPFSGIPYKFPYPRYEFMSYTPSHYYSNTIPCPNNQYQHGHGPFIPVSGPSPDSTKEAGYKQPPCQIGTSTSGNAPIEQPDRTTFTSGNTPIKQPDKIQQPTSDRTTSASDKATIKQPDTNTQPDTPNKKLTSVVDSSSTKCPPANNSSPVSENTIKFDEDCNEDKCRVVLVEIVNDDDTVTPDAVKLDLENKKRAGTILEVKHDRITNSFLVVFEEHKVAEKVVLTAKSIHDVKAKFSMYNDDPDKFCDKEEAFEVVVEKNDCNEDKCRVVLIEIDNDDDTVTPDAVKLNLENKKRGGPILQVKHDRKTNSFLVVFEEHKVAEKVVLTAKSIHDVKAKFSMYNDDPDKFCDKEEAFEVVVEKNDCNEDKCRVVLVEIDNDDDTVTPDAVKLNLENKKRGGPILQVKHDRKTNSFLVVFEEHKVAEKVVLTAKSIHDVKAKFSMYNDDPDKFCDKEEAFEVVVEKNGKYLAKYIQAKNITSKKMKEELENIGCQYKSVKAQANQLVFSLMTLEYVNDIKAKKQEAQQILENIMKPLCTQTIAVPDGINIRLHTNEMKNDPKVSARASFIYEWKTLYIVGREKKVTNCFKKCKDIILKEEEEMKQKQLKVEKVVKKPTEINFFRKFLLGCKEMEKWSKITIDFDEEYICLKGPEAETKSIKVFIFEQFHNLYSSELFRDETIILEFINNTHTQEKIETKLKVENIQGCVGVEGTKVVLVTSNSDQDERAKDVILKEISSKSVELPNKKMFKSEEWRELVKSLKDNNKENIEMQTNPETLRLTVTGFSRNVDSAIQQIRKHLDCYTVLTEQYHANDENKMKFLQQYQSQSVEQLLLEFNVSIKFSGISCELKGTAQGIEKAKAELGMVCSRIHMETFTMKVPGLGILFNHGPSMRKGEEILTWLMAHNKCLIVEGPNASKQRKILSEWSLPNRSRIYVVKGDIRLLAVDAIVNAANGQLNHGAGLAQAIVDMGGKDIQRECNKYIDKNGQIKDGEVMVSGSGNLKCKKVIHAVGPIWKGGENGEENILKNAVKNSLMAATKENLQSVAIPPISTGIFHYPKQAAANVIGKTVYKFLMKNADELKEVFLCGTEMRILNMYIDVIQKEMGETSSRRTDGDEENGAVGGVPLESTYNSEEVDSSEEEDEDDADDDDDSVHDDDGSVSDNETGWFCFGKNGRSSLESTRLKIVCGELTKQKADVVVNCTSPELDLKSGAVSRSVLKDAGNSVQDECDKKYSGGISPGDVASTSAGKLSCSKIYHGCLLSYRKDKREAEKIMKAFVKNCLEKADSDRLKIICFPALGSGHLGFPADTSATIVFEETQGFFKKNPKSSVQQVLFAVHPKDTTVLKAYEDIGEKFGVTSIKSSSGSPRHGASSDGSSRHGTSSDGSSRHGTSSDAYVAGMSVKICNGDITKESSDCIVNICNSNMEMKYGISKIIADKGGPEIQEECSQKKGDMYADGVVITGGGELQCNMICHIKIQKSSHEWEKIIKNALYKLNKERVASISFPAIGTGGLKIPPKESAEFLYAALKSFGEKNKHSKIKNIRIVIYQQEHLKEFERVFGVKKYDSNKKSHARKNTKVPREKKCKDEVMLTIYAESEKQKEVVKKKLHDRIKEEIEEKSISECNKKMLDKLNRQQRDELKEIAHSFHVKLKHNKSNNTMTVIGLSKQANDCLHQINDKIQSWTSEEQHKRERQIMKNFVAWEYEETPGGKRRAFGQGMTCKLEKARADKERKVFFTDERGRNYTVDLKEMKEYRDGSQKPIKIFRNEKLSVKGGHQLLKGEEDALKGTKTVYFPLVPKRSYDDSRPAEEYHFRVAESQFGRLIGTNGQYSVTKVEYVVNPVLKKKFEYAKQQLKKSRGGDSALPVLAFHGTAEANIQPICENGFKKLGDSGFKQTHGSKYGNGVYFSEYPTYSMGYIQGATKLLLCQVLLGKSYTCTALRSSSQVEPGYDSHISADKKELVVFDTNRILPCYIVHYGGKMNDYNL
ncbi:hypothetical protein SNE40_020113 [Patella caerulea]|uniref:Poly [ADP-ribose] polymerase n=1 Tax=Patella caerulea TaxID=87958 RepID=A0AAN8G254_PATCE